MELVNLAFDFGASSGRVIMSRFDGKKMELTEIHRFPNDPVWFQGRYYWDFLRLFHEMKVGLKKAAQLGVEIASIGIDTWGVDYALLDRDGHILSNPLHYRTDRGRGMLEEIEASTPIRLAHIYESTGIQYMSINSLYQLFYDTRYRTELIEQADSLLFMPDLFSYGLTGEKRNEYTIASTSQMLNARSRDWDRALLGELQLPTGLLQNLIKPGEVWGVLSQEIQEELGLPAIPVIAVGSHDTASAVAAAPLKSEKSAYLSCGSWSLLGIELHEPLISREAFQNNFTNEGGVADKIRFLKNINGLWIIQQLRKVWQQSDPKLGFADISKAAEEAFHVEYQIDPNHDTFVAPFNMEEAVVHYARNELNKNPQTMGEIARVSYNGIVNEYKKAVEDLETTRDEIVDCIHIVGGGVRDTFLCQLMADVTRRTVVAGPIEASAIGNVLMQLKALKHIESLEDGRRIVEDSFATKEYHPRA